MPAFDSTIGCIKPNMATPQANTCPLRIEFIESPERVAELMPDLCELLSDGLIEAHDTTVYKSATFPATRQEDPA